MDDTQNEQIDRNLMKWWPTEADLAGLVQHWRGAAEGQRQANADTLQLLLATSDQLRQVRRANALHESMVRSTKQEKKALQEQLEQAERETRAVQQRIDELNTKVQQLLNDKHALENQIAIRDEEIRRLTRQGEQR